MFNLRWHCNFVNLVFPLLEKSLWGFLEDCVILVKLTPRQDRWCYSSQCLTGIKATVIQSKRFIALKKGKIVGSIWFRIATFVRTNFNLVKQCVVFSIMPSVNALWDEEPAIPCRNSLKALLNGNFSQKVTQNLSLNHYSQSYGDLLQPEETMCRVQHSAGFLTSCEISTCGTLEAWGFLPP